jgi:hypothetical protein
MKLGNEARDGSIIFSLSIPVSLYNEISSRYDMLNRSKVLNRLVRIGLDHDKEF